MEEEDYFARDGEDDEDEDEEEVRAARAAAAVEWREGGGQFGGVPGGGGSGAAREVYGFVRQLRREERNAAPRLHSIRRDALFLARLRSAWPEWPLGANLRCGLWYCHPPPAFTCYFKSTDGHTGQWQFNLSRLNAHVILQAAQNNGCKYLWSIRKAGIIVDSTRKGKTFPDSMSRTIPIWACVINRTCYRLRLLLRRADAEGPSESEDEQQQWDRLCMPPWVGESECAQIERKLERFVEQLLASDQLTLEKIRDNLQRPLRPVWIAPEYPRPWSTTSELPDFTCEGTVTPLVLVSTAHASQVDDPQYIQGAGDDEESWAMGLTPALFWDHHDYILEYASQDTVEERIREVVARDKQRRTQGLAELTTGREGAAQQLHWIGRTGIAVADHVQVLVRPEVWKQFGLVINCADADPQVHADQLQRSDTNYLHVPLPHGKRDKQKVSALLDKALPAAYERLRQGMPVLVHNSQSLAVASFLCVAILLRHFDGATWETLQERPASPVTKPRIQKALLFVAAQVPLGKGPSRALMKELNKFFMSSSASYGI